MASFFSSHVESITLLAAVTTTLHRGYMRSKGTDSFPRDQEARFTAQDARERERGEREGAATAAAAGSRLGDDGGTRGARLFACLVVLCGLVLAHGECSAGRPRVASAVQARASCPRKFFPHGNFFLRRTCSNFLSQRTRGAPRPGRRLTPLLLTHTPQVPPGGSTTHTHTHLTSRKHTQNTHHTRSNPFHHNAQEAHRGRDGG